MKRFFLNQVIIIFGTLLIALGVNVFMLPGNINGGGITGIATILFHLFGIRISFVNLFINGVLLFFGYRFFDRETLIKTLSGIIYLSFFFEMTNYVPVYCGNVIVSSVMGGFLLGSGMGIIVRYGASSGGSDFLAFILKKKFPHISVPTFIMLIDGAVVVVSGIVFKSLDITVFSVVTLFIATKVADYIMVFGDKSKVLNIMSEKSKVVSDAILREFDRGITGIYAKGMYLRKDFIFLYCVVSPRELPVILKTVRNIDPDSFVVISEAREVFGKGFKAS